MATRHRSYAHLVLALISVACPFIGLLAMFVYQDYAYGDFWSSLRPGDDANVNAGALMGFVVVLQLVAALLAGSGIGLIFAALSLRKRRRLVSFGTAALMFNSIPFLFLLFRLLARGT